MTKELYIFDFDDDLIQEINVEMESLAAKLVYKLNNIIEQIVKKTEESWNLYKLFLYYRV